MIEVKDVHKRFGDLEVLKGISFTIEPSKVNLIIGSSGSGKSVLFKCMVGLLKPEKGQILFDGQDLIQMDNKEKKVIRQEIGMLFQGSALFDSLSVQENVMFPLNMFTTESYRTKLRRVNEVLDRVNIKNAHRKLPSEISGGMKKRVALARALVLNPKYLFCDEPNSGLDPETSLVIDNLIKELTEEYKTSTIIITHDMNTVMETGDKIVYMHQGKKYFEGTTEEIVLSDDEQLTDYIFPTRFFKDGKFKRRSDLLSNK